MATRTVEYGPYEIVCTAAPDAAGRFAPGVIVAISHGDAREETAVPVPDTTPCETEASALDQAEAAGQAWVDEHG
jgi:hypothetical protein